MRIKKGFELRSICGESVIVARGIENIDFSKVISLNESAAYLFNKVKGTDFDAAELTRLLQEEYDVDEATAMRDSERMMQEWKEAGLTE